MKGQGLIRIAGRACAALVCCASLAGAEVSVALQESPSGSYLLTGEFFVETSRRTAWEVLTDYEGISKFVSSLRDSKVVENRPTGVLIDQEAVGGILFFSRKIKIRLEVDEEPMKVIRFAEVVFKDFEVYRGSWTLSETPGGVRIGYTLEAKPRFRGPGVLTRIFLKKEIRRLLKEVRIEMEKREHSKY